MKCCVDNTSWILKEMAAPGDAPDGAVVKVELRRKDTSQGWGFRMRGGAQVNMPLFIEAVSYHLLIA